MHTITIAAIALASLLSPPPETAPTNKPDPEIEAKKEAFLTKCREWRDREMETRLTRLKNLTAPGTDPAYARQHAAEIKHLKAAIQRAKRPGPMKVPPLSLAMKVGDFGRVYPPARLQASQIISPNEVLAELRVPSLTVDAPGNSLIESDEERTCHILIRGLPTEDLLEDRIIPHLSQAYEVTGNYTYRAPVGGTNTVLVIEPLDENLVQNWLKTADPKKAAPAAKAPPAQR